MKLFHSKDSYKFFYAVLVIGIVLGTVLFFINPQHTDAYLTWGIMAVVLIALKVGDYLSRNESAPRNQR